MASFGSEVHMENDSAAGGSDNEQDEIMEDVDQDQDPEGDDDDDDDAEKSEEDNDDAGNDDEDDADEQNEEQEDNEPENEDDPQPVAEPVRSRSTTQPPVRPLPQLRRGATTATTYDIVPYVAAPQSTSINAFCATPCMRWVFTGGSDGYIRRYDWFASVNGKIPLTVAQKHPFVDSVTRAGKLLSYWENEEPAVKSEFLHVPETTDDLKLSPVYSLAVHSQSLWLLSGLESGGINLYSVRHDEGKIIHTLRKHTSAISVLTLGSDEKSVLSGSWDRNVYDWDLNTGQVTREFNADAGQVSSIQFRSSMEGSAWDEIKVELMNGASRGAGRPVVNGVHGAAVSVPEEGADAPGSPESTRSFGSLFGDDDDMGMGGDHDDPMNQAIKEGLNGPASGAQASGSMEADGDVTMGDGIQSTGNGSDAPAGGDDATTSGTANGALNSVMSTSFASNSATASNPAGSVTVTSGLSDQNVFLASYMDGTLRIWDRRTRQAIATSTPKNSPPWCMQACWSSDGNWLYAGRRNGTVEEYSVHKGIKDSTRTLKFPGESGAVSSLLAMPNGRHLICASYDNLRLYDLKHQQTKKTSVPFLIVPGHHGGVISSLYVDATCQYMISIAGNRGWEGASTEVMLGYEIEWPQ